jgi:hypothetical protein
VLRAFSIGYAHYSPNNFSQAPETPKTVIPAYIWLRPPPRTASLLAVLETTRRSTSEPNNRARERAYPMSDHPDFFEGDDFAVIVKMRGPTEKPWKWEITAPGHKKPVRQSTECFASMSAALRAGKEALRVFRLRAAA